MKRFVCFVLCLCLCLSAAGCGASPSPALSGGGGPQGGVYDGEETLEDALFLLPGQGSQSGQGGRQLVAEPMEAEALAEHGPGEFMALESYGTGLDVDKESESDGQRVRGFKGDKGCFEALAAYVELLCNEYDFALAAEPYYNVSGGEVFFDFCLIYTGEDPPARHKVEGTFSKTMCDLSLYGTIVRSTLKGALWFDPSLTGLDGGYRYGAGEAEAAPVGESALAGLWRNGDGSFSTTDGRLTAAPGQAMLLWDGEAASAAARYLRYPGDDRQEMLLEDSGGRLARVYLPLSCELTTGRVFGQEQFIIESDFAVTAGGLFEEEPDYIWPSMFAVRRREGWLVPVLAMGGGITGLWMRVMYAEGDTLVVYAAAEFDAAPYKLELLAALNTAGSTVEATPAPGGGTGGSGNCSACFGSGDCTNCGGTGRVLNPLAGTGEWVQQDCTACRPAGSGNCPFCGGDGRA